MRSKSLAAGAILAALVAAGSACRSVAVSPENRYAQPATLDDGWVTSSVDREGIDRSRIEQMTQTIRSHPELNIHAVLVEHDGRLVYEGYFSGRDERWGRPLGVVSFTHETIHDLRSVTKSVVSALVGIALRSGSLRSLDDPLLDYFPEYADLQVPERRQITIRHALTMTAGFDWNEQVPYNDPKNDEIVMTRSTDPIRYVLSRPIAAAPGTRWLYNGGTTQVLGAIVQRATKEPLAAYARRVLFEPLGIEQVEWLGDLDGVPSAASGLRLRPRDLAKFGSVYLHDGKWRGHDIIPADWVRTSTTRQLALPRDPTRGYGYLWWHACYSTRSGPVEVPTAVGNGLQRIFLLRQQHAAVTVLSGRYNDFSTNPPERLLQQFIIPALPGATSPPCPSAL